MRTVFEVLKRLRAEGMSLLYISHRMSEIEELADECTVFRNGRSIESFAAGTRSRQETIEMMIGREYKHVFRRSRRLRRRRRRRLTARGLNWGSQLNGIDLDLRPGEIVGLGGLDGQGQRELLLALFGVLRQWSGSIAVDGKPVRLNGPRAAKAEAVGMALIPEDRKTEGLMLPMSVAENLTHGRPGSRLALRRHRLGQGARARRRVAAAAADPGGFARTSRSGRFRAAISRRW